MFEFCEKKSHKCSHEENRGKVCAPCVKKIAFGNIKQEKFFINTKVEDLIGKYINKNFNIAEKNFPTSICRTCYLTLLEKGDFKRSLQTIPNYEDLKLPKDTRQKTNACNCYVCLKARFKGHIKTEKGRGHTRNIPNQTTTTNGLYRCIIPELHVWTIYYYNGIILNGIMNDIIIKLFSIDH